jgi:hypothetical protein
LCEATILGNFQPAEAPELATLPPIAAVGAEVADWLTARQLTPFLEESRAERLAEIDRIAAHVDLSLTELLQRADEEIGRASLEVEQGVPGAEGRLAQAETRHAELLIRRDRWMR